MKHYWRILRASAYLPRATSVIPPGADSDTIEPRLLGKVPGYRKSDGKWIGFTGSVADRPPWTAEHCDKAERDGAVAGLWCKFPGCKEELCANDIDIEDAPLVDEIVQLTISIIGPAPWRDHEGSARKLGMYRGEGHRKHNVKLIGPNGEKGGIDFLGGYSYFNVAGPHKSGAHYRWTEPNPLTQPISDLTEVTPEAAEVLWLAMLALVEARGWTIKRESGTGLPGGSRKPIGHASLLAPSPDHVVRALKAAPCTLDRLQDHNDVVRWLCAIKASLGPDCEAYRGEVLDWFYGHPDAKDDSYFDERWDSIYDSSLGWNWLDTATGSVVSTQEDFTEHDPDNDNLPPDPGIVAVNSMLSTFVYARRQEKFMNLGTGELLTPVNFDRVNRLVAPPGASGLKAAHNLFFRHNGPQYPSLTYQPGKPPIVGDEINTWRPSTIVPVKGDAAPWLNHIMQLMPNGRDAEHFLDWCAFTLQYPGEKIGHMPLLHTLAHGTGKDTAFAPLRAGVGEHNFKIIGPADLCGNFTDFLEAVVVFISEMKNFMKGEVNNKLKMWIAKPPDMVMVNKKFVAPYWIPNCQKYAATSNASDALSLEPDDRRNWVPFCVGYPREDKQYWKEIWDFLLHENGLAIVVHELLNRDVSKFDPGDAPDTDAKRDMIELATPESVRFLRDLFDPLHGRFANRTIIATHEIRAAVDDGWSAVPIRDVHIADVLKENGFRKIPGKHWVDGQARNVWVRGFSNLDSLATGDISIGMRIIADRQRKEKT